jgi:NADPH:quinone reductase-like Zn-dependent oxidoreductase
MKKPLKLLAGAVALLGVASGVLALVISHSSPCPAAPLPAAAGVSRMQAVRQACYGGPDVLRLERVPKPIPAADEVLVRVHVAAVNPLDWHYLRGEPYLMRLESGIGRPGDQSFGADFAGIVEAVGDSVSGFAPGDSVFGSRGGAYAEYLTVRATTGIARIPSGVSFEQAAALPVAASTALQALRDRAHVASGEHVLINGASGGVGTFAVQIAKSMGAHVTGVASTRNMDLLQSIGADATVDYTHTDFTRDTLRYDVIIDMVGNHSPSALRRVLRPGGRAVLVGGPSTDRFLGPIVSMVAFLVYDVFVPEKFSGMLATTDAADLITLAGMVSKGTLQAVIDRRFTLAEVAEAITYQEQGRSRGKNLVMVP